MYEKGLARRDRLPNYEDSDYILSDDGKKRLDPLWEYAREGRKKNYFRCPVCNQGIAFIIGHTDCIYFIYHKVDKEGYKKTGLMSFECFENEALPALYAYKEQALIHSLCGEILFDPFENEYACYHCFIKTGERKFYKPEELIKKYREPYDPVLCDYMDICNICGAQILQTMVPYKTNDSGRQQIVIESRHVCSNLECNYIYA